mmetsp:Transcript_15224/g.2180  ORF Transcript_15224/g.2180 Transcript_15224/m.2180 type:complete len:114 (+) Transcript_15224:58-399(+)
MKSLCKTVFELYNCGVFHGDICPDRVYLRKNLVGCYVPVVSDYNEASNSYNIITNFNPIYWNYQNVEITEFTSKEDRLIQELYTVGRTIQKTMLDLKSKHEENLFKNQTNIGI